MLPELDFAFKVILCLVLILGVVFWLGTIFQNLIFQKYRLYKNEAALRKARLHDEKEEKEKYKTDILGKVLSAKDGEE